MTIVKYGGSVQVVDVYLYCLETSCCTHRYRELEIVLITRVAVDGIYTTVRPTRSIIMKSTPNRTAILRGVLKFGLGVAKGSYIQSYFLVS